MVLPQQSSWRLIQWVMRVVVSLAILVGARAPLSAMSRDDFYGKTDFGTLGAISNSKSYKEALNFATVEVFGQNATCSFGRSKDLYFVVNHYSKLDEIDGPTFIGVQIVSFYEDSDPSSQIYLYRNKGWLDADSSEILLPLSWSASNQTLDQFFAYHDNKHGSKDDELAKLNMFKADFVLWHAKVKVGEQSSWIYKKNFNVWTPSLPPSISNIMMKNYLLKFDVGKSDTTTAPVIFYTRVDGISKLILRTFSPSSPDFDHRIECK